MNHHLLLRFIQRQKYFQLCSNSRDKLMRKNIFLEVFYYLELFLKTFGLQFNKIELVECNDNLANIIDRIQSTEANKKLQYEIFKKKLVIQQSYDSNPICTDNELFILQGARDHANMSEIAYTKYNREISKITKTKPRPFKKVNVFKKKMNLFFPIIHNTLGIYVNAEEKIKYVIKKIYEDMSIQTKRITDTFHIHLSGDGMGISKTKTSLMNFTFKVINENNLSTSGLYTLGIIIF